MLMLTFIQVKWPPIHFSSVKGHSEIVKLLLENNCDPTAFNEVSGILVLHFVDRSNIDYSLEIMHCMKL